MYKNNPYFLLILFAIFSLLSGNLYAQEEDKSDCVIKLEQAQIKYDQGRIQDVEPLIGECLASKSFEKTEQTQALKLLTLSYLFLEEPEKAEETMLSLLSHDHLFTVNTSIDPSEFINLYNKFRHDPLYSIGFLAGGVVTNPIITQLNSTQDLNNDARQTYTPLIGVRFGFNGEYEFKDKFYANAGIYYSSVKFQKQHESTVPTTGQPNLLGAGFKAEENEVIIEMPLLLQYHILETNLFTPYAAAGVAPSFLLSASYPGDAISNEIPGSAPVTSSTISLTNDRQRFNLYAIGVIGLKYKLGEGFLNAQLRYSFGILSSTKETSALKPNSPNLLWELSESSDGFRLHNIGISVGYTIDRYVPKKLR